MMSKNKKFIIIFASLIVGIITSSLILLTNTGNGKLYILDEIERSPDNLTPEKKQQIISAINKLNQYAGKWLDDGTVPIVGIGTDYKHESIKIKILESNFDKESLLNYERKIREVIGDDLDITMIPGNIGEFT